MPITLGMFDTSYAHIGERLRALGLDIAVRTFGKDGMFLVDGKKVPPSEVVLDYAWLTSHINADGFRDRAFDIVLGCKSIGVLQTFNAGLDHPFYRKLSAKGTRICNSSAQGVAIAEYVLGQVLARLPADRAAAQPAGRQAMADHAVPRNLADQLADHRLRSDRPGDRQAGEGIRCHHQRGAAHAAAFAARRPGRHHGGSGEVSARCGCRGAGLLPQRRHARHGQRASSSRRSSRAPCWSILRVEG